MTHPDLRTHHYQEGTPRLGRFPDASPGNLGAFRVTSNVQSWPCRSKIGPTPNPHPPTSRGFGDLGKRLFVGPGSVQQSNQSTQSQSTLGLPCGSTTWSPKGFPAFQLDRSFQASLAEAAEKAAEKRWETRDRGETTAIGPGLPRAAGGGGSGRPGRRVAAPGRKASFAPLRCASDRSGRSRSRGPKCDVRSEHGS